MRLSLIAAISERFRVPTDRELEARAAILAREMAQEAARTPRGQWTAQDVESYLDQVMSAILAGHLRDLGIGAAPGVRRCGLHGEACEVLAR